jgi:hypothetical protein
VTTADEASTVFGALTLRNQGATTRLKAMRKRRVM